MTSVLLLSKKGARWSPEQRSGLAVDTLRASDLQRTNTLGFRLTKQRRRVSLIPASVGLAAGWKEILDIGMLCVTCPVGQLWNSDPSGVEWYQLLSIKT